MRKFVKRTSIIAVAAVVVSLPLLGCDDQRSADKQVTEAIRQSRSERLKHPEDPQAAQSLLDKAAAINASNATKAHAKSLLAQAQVEAAIHQMNDPKTGLEAGNAEISRLMFEISTLGQHIRTSNTLVASYAKYNPQPVQQDAQKQISDVTGGAGKAAWVGEGSSAVPTLTAVRQQIAQIQGNIANLQNQIKTLQGQQSQVSAQAQQAGRAAEAAQGEAGVEAEKKAAGLRKQAADLSNQIDVLNAKVAPLETDLAVAQSRESALNAAVQQFGQIANTYSSGWNNIEQQIVAQKHLATAIYQGVGGAEEKANTNSITTKALLLEKAVKQTEEAFTGAEENLTSAITNFQAAFQSATALQGELQQRMSDPSVRGSEMAKIIQVLQEAFSPTTFKLGEADAQQLLATLYTSRVTSLAERERLLTELRPILSEATLSMPKQLDDPKLPALIASLAKKADSAYEEVTQLYTDIAEAGDATDAQKNSGHIGRMFANYGRAQLKRALGDAKSATKYLVVAREARDTVIEKSGPAAIPAYPSELVPPPATQPTTAPTTAPAPATAPAAAEANPTANPAGSASPSAPKTSP